MTLEQLKEYTGNEDQLITYHEGYFSDGPAAGVRFAHVSNGGNLSVVILPDRGMDIYQVRYKGKNMNYICPNGLRSPHEYNPNGDHFLRNWFAGQLSTIGLQNIGPARYAYGEDQGTHGKINNTKAENYRYLRTQVDGRPAVTLEGTMREARLFGENLSLHRKIEFEYENDMITIHDLITNEGFGERQFVLLYHINFGYPLLQEGTRIIVDTDRITPRTEEARKYLNTAMQIEAPSYPYPERCYFHSLRRNSSGMTGYTVFNDSLNIGVHVSFSGEKLPFFCEWKMLGKGEYVLGMEPTNAELDGPAAGDKGCKGPVLKPGESIDYTLEFHYIDRLQ